MSILYLKVRFNFSIIILISGKFLSAFDKRLPFDCEVSLTVNNQPYFIDKTFLKYPHYLTIWTFETCGEYSGALLLLRTNSYRYEDILSDFIRSDRKGSGKAKKN